MGVRILSPERGFTGEVAGVRFVDGVAEVADAPRAALAYMRRRGYSVSDPESDGASAEFASAQDPESDGASAEFASAQDPELAQGLESEPKKKTVGRAPIKTRG